MPRILDACCGSKMFWFDTSRHDTVYMDNRELDTKLCDGRRLVIKPNVVADFHDMPFPDETFALVVFDPPHLIRAGRTSPLTEPMHTVVSKEKRSLGTVRIGEEGYVITDIGMRMLQPRELYRAQGFPEDYIIDFEYQGKPLPKSAQVQMVGNSVCPPVATALIGANCAARAKDKAA